MHSKCVEDRLDMVGCVFSYQNIVAGIAHPFCWLKQANGGVTGAQRFIRKNVAVHDQQRDVNLEAGVMSQG